MGDPLIHVKMAAFQDELEKGAAIPGIESLGRLAARIPSSVASAAVKAPLTAGRKVVNTLGGGLRGLYQAGVRARYRGPEQAHELLDRALNPGKGLLKGWNQMSHRGSMESRQALHSRVVDRLAAEGKSPAQIEKILGKDPLAALTAEVSAFERKTGKRSPKRFLLEHSERPAPIFGEGGLVSKQQGLGGKTRATFEELGRRGWTGEGRITKYLPVGGKGITTGFAASAIPSVVNAPRAERTGEGGALEAALGEAGGTLGFVGGGGLGLVTGLGASVGGHKAGSKLGRTLDRLRAGASLGEAWSAPSPTEAAAQIAKIQKHYG